MCNARSREAEEVRVVPHHSFCSGFLSVESALGGYWRRQPCHVKKSLLDIRGVGYLAESFGRIEGRGTELIPARSINASGPNITKR